MNASRNRKLGIAAVAAVGLTAAGAAFASSKLHASSTTTRAGGVGPLAFASASGYGAGTGQGVGPRRGFGGRDGARPMGRRGGGGDLAAAASYLGLDTQTLIGDLQGGKTLAQVADATGGKSAAGLIDALVAHEQTELDQAVTDNRLTQAQADQLKANLQTRITARVNGQGPGPGRGFGRGGFGHGGFGHGGPGGGGDLAAAASYLGLDTQTLIGDLQGGKTLAQVADATGGKSAAGLIDALVAHEQTELDQAVTDNRLTQAQADQLKANLQTRITARVNGLHPGAGKGIGPRPGPPMGTPPSGTAPSGTTHI